MRLIEDRAPALPTASDAPGPVTAPEPLVSGTPRVLMVDGLPAAVDGALPDGVRLMPLREALEQHDRPIRELAQRVGLGGPSHAFTALNTAFIDRAQVLHVARDEAQAATILATIVGSDSGGTAPPPGTQPPTTPFARELPSETPDPPPRWREPRCIPARRSR